MKRCPRCSQTYIDDSLQYCLTDGELLVTDTGTADSQATLVYEKPKTKSSRKAILLIAVALFFVIAGLSATALFYFFVYKNNSTQIAANQNADTANKQPTPNPQPSPVVSATPEENTEGNPAESPSPTASPSPSPETPSASPQPSPDMKESSSKVESQFFTFELKQCKLSGSSIACDFIVINNDRDRDLTIRRNSTIFDQENNRYEARRMRLANNEDTFGVRAYMVSGVSTKASIIFEGVAPTANKLSLLYISLRTNTGEFDIEYRNVRLIR